MNRIAFVAHTGTISGPNNSLVQLLRALDRRQFDPVIFFPSDGAGVNELRGAGERCYFVPMHPLEPSRGLGRIPVYMSDLFRTTLGLRRALRRERVDLVHINTSVTPFTGLAARSLGLPIVWHIRESLNRTTLNDWYLKLVVSLAHKVVAVSEAVREQVVGRTRVDPDKVSVVHNGIDLEWFDQISRPEERAADLDLPREGSLIAVPAFLLPHKGHQVLLEATAMLVHQLGVKDFCVLIIGSEPAPEDGYGERLQAYCRSHHLTDYVRFLGLRQDVPALLVRADIVCLPSTYDDPLPRSVLEGMAAGKPVVGTRVGGIPEMVDDGRTGLLVPRGRADALASALADLIKDRSKAAQMGRAGRLRVEREFTSTMHGHRMQTLYYQLLRPGAIAGDSP